jgi:ribonuclease HII
MKARFTIGIDEVGRGPIAGPVAVGAFLFLDEKTKKVFRGVKESKQLSEAKREEWFRVIQESKRKGSVDFQVTFQSEKVIDTKGLSYAIKTALKSSLNGVVRRNKIGRILKAQPSNKGGSTSVKVLLDGGLKAPIEYVNQKTIIKGDEKEMVIALASICAKVLRDRKMNALARKYPKYGLEKHKGYGTRAHYAAIRKNGLLTIHRKSFLKGAKLC